MSQGINYKSAIRRKMEDPIFHVSSKRSGEVAEYGSHGVCESSNNQFPKSWGGSGARPRQVQQVSL